MPTHYVEDYEELTGKKIPKSEVTAKVVTAPKEDAEATKAEAETKGK